MPSNDTRAELDKRQTVVATSAKEAEIKEDTRSKKETVATSDKEAEIKEDTRSKKERGREWAEVKVGYCRT